MSQTDRYASYPSLRGRAVLISGGGSGIGASMVEHFALQGARVAFLDIDCASSEALAGCLSERCEHAPLFVRCDIADIAALRSAVAGIEARLGALRVLVNNAANDDRHKFADVTPEYWDERMAVNLRHHFFAIQAVVPRMAEAGGGSIVNMSSITWMIPSTGQPAYITAKAAIIGLTRTMAHELGPSNIRVNSVLPGAISTERQRRLWYTPELLEKFQSAQALKRTLTPDDVARLVLFLAADDSEGITNQGYIVDGGWI
jgi:NAD(P)-dependent dehydrogenase (short-subunit alcohol dehydrogenase family)